MSEVWGRVEPTWCIWERNAVFCTRKAWLWYPGGEVSQDAICVWIAVKCRASGMGGHLSFLVSYSVSCFTRDSLDPCPSSQRCPKAFFNTGLLQTLCEDLQTQVSHVVFGVLQNPASTWPSPAPWHNPWGKKENSCRQQAIELERAAAPG